MKARLFLSWVVLVLGGAYGGHLSYSGQVAADPLVAALRTGYGSWGLYWGLPIVLRWWVKLDVGRELVPRLAKLLIGCFAVPSLGFLYGVLGGGLFQFLRAWWQVRA